MKLINYKLSEPILHGNVSVINKGNTDIILFGIDDKYWLIDDVNYINSYCYQMFNFDFNSVLIGGLGMGLIPYYMLNNMTEDIDVIEINSNVIDVVNQMGHLGNINIINNDVLIYKPTKKYDLIIMDLWWLTDGVFESQKNNIISNYLNSLNDGGKLYFPITDEIFTK